jgi:hypothetical protein
MSVYLHLTSITDKKHKIFFKGKSDFYLVSLHKIFTRTKQNFLTQQVLSQINLVKYQCSTTLICVHMNAIEHFFP